MRFLSLFSGLDACSQAWVPMGWECVGFAEIEPFPCKVLKFRFPNVLNLGNVINITAEQLSDLGDIDLIAGGFPCTDVSVAGKRKGLKHADGTLTRSGLFYEAMRIIELKKPRWVVIENVPGLFSSNEGRDFAAVVGELAGCEIDVPADGWRNAGVACGERGLVEWFTLDAQYVRVESFPRAIPQRRRRVFFVRDSGDWQNRPPLFLVPESMSWNPPTRRQAGQGTAPTFANRARGGGGHGTDFECDGGLIPEVVGALNDGAHFGGGAERAGRLQRQDHRYQRQRSRSQAGTSATNRSNPQEGDPCHSLAKGAHAPAIAIRTAQTSSNGCGIDETETAYTIDGANGQAVASPFIEMLKEKPQWAIRRLTELECERLFGMADGFTAIPGAKGGPRYRAIGNSIVLNCLIWIGQRINFLHDYK